MPVLVLVNISNWLAPFMVYHYFTGDPGDRVPLAVIYALCTFVVVEVLSLAIGIVGSRLAAGRLRPGCYPLWGWTYFRWWLSDRLADLAPVHLLSGTPLLNGYLRAQGARIGRNVVIDSVTVRAPALLTVGDGVCIGTLVYVDNVRVHDGELIVGRVTLDRDASVDSYALLGENSAMGIGARLSGLSALASGSHVPDGETWQGAPAQRVAREDGPLPPRPVVPATTRIARNVYFVYASLAVAVLFLAPVFPSFMLIDWIDVRTWDLYGSSAGPVVAFFAYFLLAIPASALLVVVTVLLASGLRRAAVLRQQPGIFPVYGAAYRHKWLTSRILETSLSVLHGLYASVFAPIWLRLMGAQIGRFTEVSTAVGIMPDLLSLGDDSFIADAAMLGDEEQRGGWMTLRTTSVGNRSFVGNGAYLADGAKVPDDVLIGVQTRAPENSDMQAGQTWFGSPALSLPAREHIGGFGDHLTSRPSSTRRASRGSIELLRIVLPLAFVTATGYLVVQTVMPIAGDEAWLRFAEMMAIAGIAFAASSFLLVLVLKWTLIGRYQPRAAPMWTPFVWVSEAVTNIYESLAVPNLLEFLRGTPLLPWALRLLGAHIGKGVYLDTTDLTEFDCVHIGDGSALNAECGPQTHLFEDRVMKIGDVEIGANVTVGTWSTVLYNTAIGDGVTLAPFTVVAKGERLPPHTRWQGAPAAPERENLDNAEPRPLPSRTVSRPY